MTDSEDPYVGTRLGKFRIVAHLGHGGQGRVYEAVEKSTHRRVAVKILPSALAKNSSDLKRFLREASLASTLQHPNLVTVYEIARAGDDHFIVMELVEGLSLDRLLVHHRRLPPDRAAHIIAGAGKGLHAAHLAGVVHRDIKPSNIMVTPDGTVKLGDFGLLKASRHVSTSVTATGTVVGTPLYMSPEQCRSEPVDSRSDIYALGATYYHLLTGKPPFRGNDAMGIMFSHCSSPIPDPRDRVPELPASCSAIVRRAMAKEPRDRYPNVRALLADLQPTSA